MGKRKGYARQWRGHKDGKLKGTKIPSRERFLRNKVGWKYIQYTPLAKKSYNKRFFTRNTNVRTDSQRKRWSSFPLKNFAKIYKI